MKGSKGDKKYNKELLHDSFHIGPDKLNITVLFMTDLLRVKYYSFIYD
jgi:hypothetical protein